MDENTRAMHAQLLLDNPVFIEALDEVNKSINRELDKVKPDDIKSMQGLVMQRQSVNKIIQHIYTSAKSGQVVAYNAAQKRKFF